MNDDYHSFEYYLMSTLRLDLDESSVESPVLVVHVIMYMQIEMIDAMGSTVYLRKIRYLKDITNKRNPSILFREIYK